MLTPQLAHCLTLVLFLSAAFFKMKDINPGLSCRLPLVDSSAFPHAHVTESRSGRPQIRGAAGRSDLPAAGWRQSAMPAAPGDKVVAQLYPGDYQDSRNGTKLPWRDWERSAGLQLSYACIRSPGTMAPPLLCSQ